MADDNAVASTSKKQDYDIGDVLIEVLEVAVNLILYVRNIYPEGIFQRCQKYNIKVMMCQHPEVNAYIRDVLTSIHSLVKQREVEKIVLQITDSDNEPLERFCFELKMLMSFGSQCFLDLESHLRALLLKINTCEALLQPLPKGCSFQILVHTKKSSLNKMQENSNFLDFPWVRSEERETMPGKDSVVIPVRSCSTEAFVLQCYVEEKKTKVRK